MPGHSDIPQILIAHLQKLEPDANFTGSLPAIQSSTGTQYFGKIGSLSEKDQYIGETESLQAMNKAAPGLSPFIIASGFMDSSGNESSMGRPYSSPNIRFLDASQIKRPTSLLRGWRQNFMDIRVVTGLGLESRRIVERPDRRMVGTSLGRNAIAK
jgi:hypothetical protein